MEDMTKSKTNQSINNVDYKIDGECPPTCGKCCQSILPISEYEIKKITKFLQRNPEVYADPINKNSNPFSENYVDRCPFLDENNRCKIYIHRPEICSVFTCGKQTTKFNYADKKLINMWSEFYPDEVVLNAPDIIEMNSYFQEMKKKANQD